MKKLFKKLTSVLLAVIMIFSITGISFADSNIAIEAKAEVKAKYICLDCEAVFANEYDYQNHIAEEKAKYICFDCKAVFTNEYDYQNHVAEEKASKEYENACTNAQVEIRTPSITKISYGDSIVLHADLIALPPKWKIVWTSDNNNFLYLTSPDAKTCTIFPASSGDTTFTATVYDEDENIISTDTQKMTSKAGFFDKIIAFFKNLFGATKTIPQMLKDLI